jgi:hypothetical protein
MNTEKIQEFLEQTLKEDDGLIGLTVFNMVNSESVGSTFDDDHTNKVMEIEKMFYDLETGDAEKKDPVGGMNWVMSSYARKIIFNIRITKDIFIFGEAHPMEAPSAVIEDGLEMALMIGRMLEE